MEGRTYQLVEIAAPTGYQLNGTPIEFILTESPSSQMEYDLTGDQLDAFDTRIKTEVSVRKEWIGPMADSVTVYLKAGGSRLATAVLNAENNWQYTFSNLNMYDLNGEEILYEVEEEPLEGYATGIEAAPAAGGYVITNTNTEKIDIPVEKQWVGPEAERVIVNLLSDGAVIAEAELTAEDNWQHTFTQLPKYDSADGHEIQYSVQEEPLEGYEPGYDGTVGTGLIVINTNTEKIDIPVVKRWIGPVAEEEIIIQAVPQSGTRGDTMPVMLVIELLADGTFADVLYLSEADAYSGVFEGLPKYDSVDGHEIVYTINEVNVPEGYEVAISENPEGGFLITNTNTEKLDIPVEKRWVGPEAERVIVNLLSDGAVIDEAELTAEDNWQHSFTQLPKYDSADGHEIQYSVQEEPLEGYEPRYDGSVESGLLIINTNTEKIDISVEKRWVGPEAERVIVNLLSDGTAIDEAELTAEDNWQHSFTQLPKYDSADGHEIQYSVQEEPMEGYEPYYGGNVEVGLTITNVAVGQVVVPVQKVWIGPAAESVTVNLLADGAPIASAVLNAENAWQYLFQDLEQYDNGVEIRYTVEEVQLEGYSSRITGDPAGGYTITNTNTETLDIPVQKVWIGPGSNPVLILLYADGHSLRGEELNAGNDWHCTFTNLPRYDAADGHEIVYDVEERSIAGYTPSRSGTPETGFTFTNTIVGKVSIPVTKVWVGPAAESVTVNLLADGKAVATAELNAENKWQYTFTDFEQYDNGVEILYTVEEVPLPGYRTRISGDMAGYTITNTSIGTIDIPVTKLWVGKPGAGATIRLYADGALIETAVLDESSSWAWVFRDLPRYDTTDGHRIQYTISEDAIAGYAISIRGDMDAGYEVTNTRSDPPPSKPPRPGKPPKTGDESNLPLYLLMTLLSGCTLTLLLALLRKARTKRSPAGQNPETRPEAETPKQQV